MTFIDDTILKGAIDLHVHVGPDYSPRYSDAIRLAREAAAAGMRAIVIKKHLASTVGEAYEASQVVPEVSVFGGIALNAPCGGLSVRSVTACVKAGGKMIWLPTTDAKYAMDLAARGHWIKEYVGGCAFGETVEPLTVLDENGALKPEVCQIMAVCKEYGAILGGGHVVPDECLALAREAHRIGYTKLEITHPNDWEGGFSIELCRELASLGATLTMAYGACSPHNGRQDPHEIADMINAVGAQHMALITDYGQVASPAPADGMRVFYYLLRRLGISDADLHAMIVTNPARLLDLEPLTEEV